MTDDDREAEIRKRAEHHSEGWMIVFLLRLLDEARASITDLVKCNAAMAAERDESIRQHQKTLESYRSLVEKNEQNIEWLLAEITRLRNQLYEDNEAMRLIHEAAELLRAPVTQREPKYGDEPIRTLERERNETMIADLEEKLSAPVGGRRP